MAKEDGEEGKKKKGGVQVPDEWPWEQAKKLFEKPDVTPADELEVRLSFFVTGNLTHRVVFSLNGKHLMWMGSCSSSSRRRASSMWCFNLFNSR